MFTGIIKELGNIISIKEGKNASTFIVKADPNFIEKAKIGDSISVNGACMTVENKTSDSFTFTSVSESLKKTNLSDLKVSDKINLEGSLTMSSALDGHMVSGHVDCTGIINELYKDSETCELFIQFPAEFSAYVIYKGSICINGISLTIAEITNEGEDFTEIKVAIIPHTFENTNLKSAKVKDKVNLEFDIIGKYINRKIQLNKK